MTTYYSNIEFTPSLEDPRRLVYRAVENCPTVPNEVTALRLEYSKAERVAAVLFDSDISIRKEAFRHLYAASYGTFVGAAFSLNDGRANLSEVQEIITDFAHIVRDRLYRNYTILMFFCGVIPLAVGLFIFKSSATGLPFLPEQGLSGRTLGWLIAAFWVPAGAAVAVWTEFVLRMQGGLKFDELLLLDLSRWKPAQRVTITIVVAFIFAYLLACDFVRIGAGNVLLNEFLDKDPVLALAVGGVTGLSFTAIMDVLHRIRPVERQH